MSFYKELLKREEQNKNGNYLVINELRKYMEVICYEIANKYITSCHICQHYIPIDLNKVAFLYIDFAYRFIRVFAKKELV